MKRIKNTGWPIAITSIYLLVYVILLYSDSWLRIAFVMLLLSPFVLGWMVFSILKYGKASDRTFDDYFYDDVDLKRSR